MPSTPKSFPGWLVGGGAGLLLLAAGGFLVWMLLREKDDIDDLALVPPNAQGVICVKVDALWKTPTVRKAADQYARDNPGKPGLAERLEAETGLKPDQIERVTVVFTNAARSEGWSIVRTREPYDAETIRKRTRARPIGEVDPTDGPTQDIVFAGVSPRVFVFGQMEASVRQALNRVHASATTLGPLTPVIERCRQHDHVVFGYNPAAAPPGKMPNFDLRPLNDANLYVGTLNVLAQVELEIRAKTDDNAKAEKLNGTLTGWLRMAKTGLAFAAFMPGEQGKQAIVLNKLLGTVKLAVDDKDIVATSKADADKLVPQLLGLIP